MAAVVVELQTRLSLAEQARDKADGELAAAQVQIDRLRKREDDLKRILQVITPKKVYTVASNGVSLGSHHLLSCKLPNNCHIQFIYKSK